MSVLYSRRVVMVAAVMYDASLFKELIGEQRRGYHGLHVIATRTYAQVHMHGNVTLQKTSPRSPSPKQINYTKYVINNKYIGGVTRDWAGLALFFQTPKKIASSRPASANFEPSKRPTRG